MLVSVLVSTMLMWWYLSYPSNVTRPCSLSSLNEIKSIKLIKDNKYWYWPINNENLFNNDNVPDTYTHLVGFYYNTRGKSDKYDKHSNMNNATNVSSSEKNSTSSLNISNISNHSGNISSNNIPKVFYFWLFI